MINMNRNNLRKQKFFGVFNNFKEYKGVPSLETWRNADLALGFLTLC